MGLPEEGGAVVYHQAKVARVAPGTRASANQAPSLQQEGKGRGSKLVVVARQGGLTPDRVWARRAARRTVAFDCSHQTTGAGGESGQGWGGAGCTCPHHPTRAGQGPLWPPIAPPAQLPLHQRVWCSPAPKCSEWIWCLAASESQTATGGAIYASSVLGHPAPCTSPMHFDQQTAQTPNILGSFYSRKS